MKFLFLATILSSVICQQWSLRTDNWSLNLRRFDECVRVDGRAVSAQTDRDVEIRLFRGTNCNGPYAYAGGNWNFDRPYDFQSAWIVRRRRRSLTHSDAPQASESEDIGGEEQDSIAASKLAAITRPSLMLSNMKYYLIMNIIN